MGDKKDYLITHTHRHGVSSGILNCDPDIFPQNEQKIADILDIDFEPDRDERIEWILLETLDVTKYAGQDAIRDDFYEKDWPVSELAGLLTRYRDWCSRNNQLPEVESVEEINESNISHVAYHAEMPS